MSAMSWVVLVPVKRGELAKSRLAEYAGELRPDLARAFAVDCLSAALRADGVVEALVVTDDEPAAARLRSMGCFVVPDLPNAGLNAAVTYGAAVAADRHPRCAVAALASDLPALRSADLSGALIAAAAQSRAFASDKSREGTNLLTAGVGVPMDARFGGRSREAHLAAGAVELGDTGTIRWDVDDPSDLDVARALGVGPATQEVIARLEHHGTAGPQQVGAP